MWSRVATVITEIKQICFSIEIYFVGYYLPCLVPAPPFPALFSAAFVSRDLRSEETMVTEERIQSNVLVRSRAIMLLVFICPTPPTSTHSASLANRRPLATSSLLLTDEPVIIYNELQGRHKYPNLTRFRRENEISRRVFFCALSLHSRVCDFNVRSVGLW